MNENTKKTMREIAIQISCLMKKDELASKDFIVIRPAPKTGMSRKNSTQSMFFLR